MRQKDGWAAYAKRFQRVTDYIHDHLDGDLDIERISEIACLSPFHWHRIYRAMHQETLAQTVKRLRLHRAAGDLANTSLSIAQIARRSGYPNIRSFTRVFAEVYGLPPARYRKEGSHIPFQSALSAGDPFMYDVAIKDTEAMTLIAVPHKGSYMGIGKAFETLHTTLGMRRLHRPGMIMLGIYLDDPELTPEAELRSFACVTLPADIDAATAFEPPFVRQDLPAGRTAVLVHKGPYANMHAAYQWLYRTWLPASGEKIRNAPAFEVYLNTPMDAAPQDLLTEIHLPIE